ncbi:bifunctional YncE family protein/alkaline phosphatase family protein [Armatimonas rosea]|uniref:YVTN family beta-propeller protein n=1 Tax=Armatimonas rosea TaxID=685828 RepID=A0A7W9W737_ARMRO|nr:alkaline phosphatase family protein [Armatimonas rosea]MBB6050821.1 YVTN family beta-propeller protein [Armatimonas rosea]
MPYLPLLSSLPSLARTGGLLSAVLLASAPAPSQNKATPRPYLHAPSVESYATFNPEGRTIMTTGRFLEPVGTHTPVATWPHGLVLSPDRQTAFVASDGVGQLLAGWQSGTPTVTELKARPGNPQEKKRRNNTGAVAFSPDGKQLYWGGGDSSGVQVFEVATGAFLRHLSLNVPVKGKAFRDSYVMDLKLSADGKWLYCADVANFRLATLSTQTGKVVSSIAVGRYPYALAVAGSQVYVANIGQFAYQAIPAPKTKAFDKLGLTRPAFAYPSKEARDGVEFEGRRVPGLGDPKALEAFSVWGVELQNPERPKVIRKVKTGLVVGATSDNGKAIGGSAPNFLEVRGKILYISNDNNDSIETLDLATGKLTRRTKIQPSPLTAKLRGVQPSGLTLSPDGSRLYIAESGINAIGVLDTKSGKVIGHIPTAWYPYRVGVSADGKQLCVICFRGFGNGPSAGANVPKSPYRGLRGVFTTLPTPSNSQLAAQTQSVLANNGMVDSSADRATLASPVLPTQPGKKSEQIKYVVFITKENHSYDAVFDRVPGAKHDPSLVQWGYHQKVSAPGQPTLDDVAVMTNHNALARQFAVSDNFYMMPEGSGVGHRWLVGVEPNNFCQMLYTLGWEPKLATPALGRHASFDSNGSLTPEDYPEAGSMWEHLARFKVPFRNYGEGFEFAGVGEDEDEEPTGAREVVNIPMSKVLFDNTCFDFPIFNMNIPDQYRADWFEKDFTKLFLTGKKKKTMPGFINIAICNDHGDDPKPKKGYPYRASWMADNDLALGRIVEFLSHTPYWKNMAIFVTQDDSGGEPDHVDAQRSVLLAISPWIKRGYVSHRHTTILSMHRTLYQLHGLPPLNLHDALANDFSDCFTTTPDFTPYTHTPVDKRLFDPKKAIDPKDPNYKAARLQPSIRRDALIQAR